MEEAKRDFEKGMKLDPANARIRQNYGRYMMRTGNLEQAVQELEEAHRMMPYDDSILLDMALARLNQGRRAEAKLYLTRARELQPANNAVIKMLNDMQKDSP
jgi:Tfp pilus assembly protein PilF